MLKRIVVILLLLAGCSGEQAETSKSDVIIAPVKAEQNPASAMAESGKAPFEYREVSRGEEPHFMGPQVILELETTNDVAKETTEDDLGQFWEHIAPTLGNRRVFIRLKTPVPGVVPWGLITRINDFDGNWKVEIQRNEFGVDAEPYYFADKIDRSKQNQRAMILTLPVVNRIIERLKRDGWTINERQEDFVSADKSGNGIGSLSVTLTPEGIDLNAHRREDIEVFDVIGLLTDDLGIGNKIKQKMQAVIGSPEYYRGNSNGVGVWNWTIGTYDVSYYHTEPGLDDISIGYAQEPPE